MGTESSINNKAIEQLQRKPGKDEFLIVGIGASAGGIQALQIFFKNVPADSGMAYVVILHLSPSHDSQLAQVLQRETSLPITQVTKRVKITPDHIFVISPNQHLTMEDEYIAVSRNILMEERRAPVDIFFRTLADEHGPRSIGVILSGTGANGSMGLKRIKERGGACFVQNPREAEFNEMPRNAIATELVDEILGVRDIPAKILSYKTSIGKIEIVEDSEKRPADQQQALREIFTQIRVITGHDFSNYKRPTLLRRIERRINIHGLPDLPAFAKYIQDHPDESIALLKDLLISVTNFFRDKKPFEMIEQEVMPVIFKGKTSAEHVRIWVAGCATGEEAYSIAMLCAEKTMGSIDAPKVQIFATDIDEAAISHAREGLYTLNDTADVSPERLRRFFNKEGDYFRIRREIRETVMFATHNFLKDPPFSHLDMVTCRNVMIYLNQVAQERVIETFHFALNPGGYLFLGTSESVDGASDLYAGFNRENHIFQSRQATSRAYPIPESNPALYYDKFKKEISSQEQENKILERISFGDLHQQLLEQYAPPSLVVNGEYDIMHLTERAGQFLQIGGGELSQNLLKLIKPELRLELRSALYQAIQRQSAVECRGLKVNVDDKTETINIHVRPVLRANDTAKGFMLVIFEPSEEISSPEIILASDVPVARQLEEELIRLKLQLRAASEQHDFQAEEMKASNEELQAMNEELRSSAEELETSKEELQSINEELRTVNQELKVKIEETSIASNNLLNLINSTDIGTIFLDRSFRVALYTPAASTIFNLIPADHGRPLTDITHKLAYTQLLANAELVLEKLHSIEKEVNTIDNKTYLMRLTPYRTDEDRIKGVVITFIDITQRKKSGEELKASELKYRTLFDSIDEGVSTIELIVDKNDRVIDYVMIENNPAMTRLTGVTDDMIGIRQSKLTPELEGFWIEKFEQVVKSGISQRFEHQIKAFGNQWYEVYSTRIGGEGSRTLVNVYKNIAERKLAEERQAFLLQLSDAMRPLQNVEEIQETTMRVLGEYMHVNRAYFTEVSSDKATLLTRTGYFKNVPSLVGTMKRSDLEPKLAQIYHSGKNVVTDDVQLDPGFSEAEKLTFDAIQFRSGIGVPLVKQGNLLAIVTVQQSTPRHWTIEEINLVEDIGERTWAAVERARAEEELRKSEQRLKRMVNVPQVGVVTFDLDGKVLHANDAFVELLGYERSDFEKQEFTWRDFTPPQYVDESQKILEKLKVNTRGGPYEKQYKRKDGTLQWMMFVSSDLGDGTIVEYTVDISERKKIEEAFRKSEEHMHLATTAAKMGTFVYYINEDRGEPDEQMLSLFGLPRDSVLNLNTALEQIIHADDREQYAKKVAEATNYAGTGKLNTDIRIIFPDGSVRWINVSAQTYFQGDPPRATTMSGVALDITERKKTEEALRLSEERLRITMESAVNYAVITTTTDGIIDGWSRGAQYIFGYAAEEAIGKPVDIIYTDEDKAKAVPQKEMAAAQQQGNTPDERWHLRKDGSKFYVSGVLAIIRDVGLPGYVKVARDMTEQKRAEEQLALFEERNRVALQSAEMASWDWNIKEDKVVWNEQHFLLFGLVPDGLEKESAYFMKFVHPLDKERIKKALTTAVDLTGVYKAEFRIRRDDNRELRWMSGFGRAIEWDEHRKASRMVGVMFDITDRKNLEQQKEDFLSIASHELKTPVTSIMAYGELLQETIEVSHEDQTLSLIQKMNSQISKLNNLISDLLDTTKIAEGQLILNYEEFDLNESIRDIAQEMQPLSHKHKLKIPDGQIINVYADRKRIEQVMINLISNAIKYSPEGGDVVVNCEVGETAVTLSVADSGIGIPKESQEKVFNRFFRVKNARSNNYPGMGLGLYISAGIAHSHGGTMHVSSNPGKGSVFYFTLPFLKKPDQS